MVREVLHRNLQPKSLSLVESSEKLGRSLTIHLDCPLAYCLAQQTKVRNWQSPAEGSKAALLGSRYPSACGRDYIIEPL
jgi:hypothetical protein